MSEFKSIPGFDNYEINEEGVVRKKAKILPTKVNYGMPYVMMTDNKGKQRGRYIKGLLAKTFNDEEDII